MKPNSKIAAGWGMWLLAQAALLALSASADHTITWSRNAGGGGTSTNSQYSVSGTIGQPDASGASTNGPYTLVGGFWAGVLVQTPGAPTLHLTNAAPGFVAIWWTPANRGYVLQSSDAMVAANWSNAPSGTNNPATVPTIGPARFYRLAKPVD